MMASPGSTRPCAGVPGVTFKYKVSRYNYSLKSYKQGRIQDFPLGAWTSDAGAFWWKCMWKRKNQVPWGVGGHVPENFYVDPAMTKLVLFFTSRIIFSISNVVYTFFNFPVGNSPNLGVSYHLEVIRTGTIYIPAGNSPNLGVTSPWGVQNRGYIHPSGNSPNLGVSNLLKMIGTGVTYIPAENSPNLGMSHHLEVIRTGTTYIPARNSPNLGVSHFLEVIGTEAIPTSQQGTHLTLVWAITSRWLEQELPTFQQGTQPTLVWAITLELLEQGLPTSQQRKHPALCEPLPQGD